MLTTTDQGWRPLRLRLTLMYIVIAIGLVTLSSFGHARLLQQVNQVFGGFFWANDTDGSTIIVSTPAQLLPFDVRNDALTSNSRIVSVNNVQGPEGFTQAYMHARVGDPVSYRITQNGSGTFTTVIRPASIFTIDIWWQSYGLGLLAGLCWLLVGLFLLSTAKDWTGAVEGMTMLPPSMLLLLYSHWGNVQQADQADLIFQFLWIPAFALLGAAFIHLSLTYRPAALTASRRLPHRAEIVPYLPLVALMAYEWGSYLIQGYVPTRLHLLLSLGYAACGGLISLGIGLHSLFLGGARVDKYGNVLAPIPAHVRQRNGNMLTLWIVGICIGTLLILPTRPTFFTLPMFYICAIVYPLVLLYAVHTLRQLDRLHITLEQREEALYIEQNAALELREANSELQHATSLLLHADAHLRSILSQRIHDQPEQQALRIRSLLAHWQHKLRVESEGNSTGRATVQPIIEALGKVRKISEELEGDLRGLQLLVEDAYQRRSLGLKLHLEKLIREDLPALYPESPLQVQADLWALDMLPPDLELSAEGIRIAEAISYTVTQALLNSYNHAGASFATVRTVCNHGSLDISLIDDGRGFDLSAVSPEKTSLFKARLKAREAGGTLLIKSLPRPQLEHGTTIMLHLPLPNASAHEQSPSSLEALQSP